MIKVIIPEIAQQVGTTAALLLQHINYWMFTQEVDKVFRTNNELIQDLNGMFTLFQIQYAKKKLVDNGFLIVSYDKKFDRTSHYTFTEKAVSLLKEHTEYLIEKRNGKTINQTPHKTGLKRSTSHVNHVSGTVVPESENMAVNADYDGLTDGFINHVIEKQIKKPIQQTNKGMQKAFEEQGKKRKDVITSGVPDSLKHLMRKKVDKKKDGIDTSPINEEHLLVNEQTSHADQLSNETLESICVFKRVPSVDLFEKRRIISEQMLNFKEEY